MTTVPPCKSCGDTRCEATFWCSECDMNRPYCMVGGPDGGDPVCSACDSYDAAAAIQAAEARGYARGVAAAAEALRAIRRGHGGLGWRDEEETEEEITTVDACIAAVRALASTPENGGPK